MKKNIGVGVLTSAALLIIFFYISAVFMIGAGITFSVPIEKQGPIIWIGGLAIGVLCVWYSITLLRWMVLEMYQRINKFYQSFDTPH